MKEEPEQDFYKIGNFNELCDDSCKYHCTKGNTQLADCLSETKQETIEEAYSRIFDNKLDRVLKAGFIKGAKWNEEQHRITIDDAYNKGFENGKNYQAEISYSEEEVKNLLEKALTYQDNDEIGNLVTSQRNLRFANFINWFEQFKKK